MYDDFVKRKDMKREGYPAASLHSFSSSGGNSRYPAAEGPEGGGLTKFVRHDPRQVCVEVKSSTVKQRLEEKCQQTPDVFCFCLRRYLIFCTNQTYSVTGVTLT